MSWFSLGRNALSFTGVGDGNTFAARFLSDREMETAQRLLDYHAQVPVNDRVVGAQAAVRDARALNSLYAKIQRYAAGTMMDALATEVDRADDLYPEKAPHAIITGPQFPGQEVTAKIRGVLMSIVDSRLLDRSALFGDPAWADTDPAERLAGRRIKFLSGPHKGETYEIAVHVIEDVPHIRLLGDPIADAPGPLRWRFVISGVGLPDVSGTDVARGGDWAIVTAMRGSISAVLSGTELQASLFGNDYWYVEDDVAQGPIKRTLVGRTINIEGGPSLVIERHDATDIAADRIVVSTTAGISAPVNFTIKASSPAWNGKQRTGTLFSPPGTTRYGLLEPTTRVWISPHRFAAATGEARKVVEAATEKISRYHHLRFARYTGSLYALRTAQHSYARALKSLARETATVRDLAELGEALDLPLRVTE